MGKEIKECMETKRLIELNDGQSGGLYDRWVYLIS
jgi:hypothetical protein